mmetsp:Transcript_21488/g.49614  ORF Transcript_21488/g.49614 Transcript_21488/m.49614 type:complete len:102 (-) Transcript_21488:586-891(-)
MATHSRGFNRRVERAIRKKVSVDVQKDLGRDEARPATPKKGPVSTKIYTSILLLWWAPQCVDELCGQVATKKFPLSRLYFIQLSSSFSLHQFWFFQECLIQ